jgi:hypothetical protein
MPAVPSAGSQQPWTGVLEFGLYTPHGVPAGIARLVVRADDVEVRTVRRHAVIPRARLARWLRVHSRPLAVDGVVWTVRRSAFAVQIDGGHFHEVPDKVTNHLLKVL